MKRIQEIRESRGMTRRELAAALRVNLSTITRLENGQLTADDEWLAKLARALHCSIADLRAAVGQPPPKVRFRGMAERGPVGWKIAREADCD
jgi:transcriptional regulator with XRE-family HTH domain